MLSVNYIYTLQEMESVKNEFDQQFSEGYFPGWPVSMKILPISTLGEKRNASSNF